MKRTFICIIAIMALTFGAIGTASAQDRAGRFDAGGGLGFNVGHGGNAAFIFAFGGDYYFTNMIAVNPVFFISVDGAFLFGIYPRARFTFDLPWDNFEAFAAAGPGFIVGENSIKDWMFGFGGGLFYWLLDGHLGLGTDMNFVVTGLSTSRFRFIWAVASILYRF